MATTRKRRGKAPARSEALTPQAIPVAGEEDTLEGMDTPDGGTSANIFDNMGDDDYVMVWRRGDVSKQLVFHGKLTEHETTEENLIERFGGGEYVLREKRRNREGKMVWGRQRGITLAGPYKDPAKNLPVQSPRPAAEGQPATGPLFAGGVVTKDDVQVASMLQMLQMQQQAAAAQAATQQQMQQMMLAQMEAQRQGMLGLVEMATKMRDQPKENPLEMFKVAVDLVKGAIPVASPKSDIKELMDGMHSILAFRDELTPAAATGNPLMDSVPKVLDLVQQGFALKRAETEGARRPMPTVKTHANIPEPAPTPAVEDGMPLWQKVLTAQKRQLIAAASSGRDPEVAALAAVEFMPQAIRGAMEEFMRRDDVLTQVYAVVPELQEFPHWTESFFTEARAQLLGDIEEDPGEGAGTAEGEDGDGD